MQETDALKEYCARARDVELYQAVAEAVNKRKLVTVRTIDALDPIEGADLIEVATVEGWKLVVKRGEFKVGDPCVYFEIDSFLPDGVPAWQFLVDKSSREFEGVKGHKLRTIKLRGQVSQGLALPVHVCSQIAEYGTPANKPYPVWQFKLPNGEVLYWEYDEDLRTLRQYDFSELLGVKKYEAPLPAELVGQAQGLFPSFIKKTDQERCQNLKAEIFGYDDVIVPFSVDGLPSDAVDSLIAKGVLKEVQGHAGKEYVKVMPAKADRDARYEITMKMDGSSMTTFHRDGEVGVCSRNLQLKVNDDNSGNTFVRMLIDSGLQQALPLLGNVAIQGELMGPAIQGNRENFKDFRYYVFDIFLIDEGRYATPAERRAMFDRLTDLGVDTSGKVFHVPVLHEAVTLQEIGITSIEDLLKMAEGPSLVHAIREGLVFKRVDGQFSFKAISNLFLAKEKD
jgi:hypothetical protein